MRLHRFPACAALLFGFLGAAQAQQDLTGTWAGELAVSPETSLTIHFVLTRADDGSYSAMLTSPDQGGVKDVPVNSVSFDGSHLMMSVDALSGSYDGMLAGGSISGEWKQEGATIPLALSPYEKPTLTQADIEYLSGSWTGALTTFNIELNVVFRFEVDDDGNLTAAMDSPDQGANGIPVTDVELVDGELVMKIPRVLGEYVARTEGDRMVGTWKQAGMEFELTVTRGEYTPETAGLDLSPEAMTALEGAWKGQLGPLELIIRFETEDGEPVGFLDVPAQGASNVPVTSASLVDGTLTFQITAIAATYAGIVSGNEITGQWQQGPGGPLDLTLTRE